MRRFEAGSLPVARRRAMVDGAKRGLAVLLSVACAVPTTFAQGNQAIAPVNPGGSVFVRPYRAPEIPPVRLTNSPRLRDLIRGGNLYLTVQDAIALALENNIDIESARYNALLDESQVRRAEAGGPLPGVPSGSSQAGTVAAGQGVSGSQAAAGVSTSGQNQSQSNSVGATISQIGPTTPTLDPVFQNVDTFTHKSTPQPNIIQSAVTNLISNTRNYNSTISQGLISGGQVSLSYRDSYLNENAPTDVLNPTSVPTISLSFQHNLLFGFGAAVNGRNIIVAKNNVRIDDFNFKTQVINTVVNVLTVYYGLVADIQDVKAKQSAVELAQRFYEDNKKQVQIGTMAPLDVTTAESQVATSQQDLVTSQVALEQQEVALKNLISRTGLLDPLIGNVPIIPLDRIDVPEKDDVAPTQQLIATAKANRPDIAAEQMNLKNAEISARGTENGVLPQLAVLAGATNQGLSGVAQTVPVRTRQQSQTGIADVIPPGYVRCPPGISSPSGICQVPDPYFVGGFGTAIGQVFRRNFPTERAGTFIAPTLRNQTAQADYAIEQLGVRQQQLQTQKDINQVAVDVSNQVTALQQARARYQAAVRNRILEQQLLDAEQKKFALGASTTFNVVQQQRDLATAQSAEIAALVAYSNARVSLDQTLGLTLKSNNISMDDARAAHVMRQSVLPQSLPQQR